MLAGGAAAFAKPPAPKAPPPRVTPSQPAVNISNVNTAADSRTVNAPVRSAPAKAAPPARTIATTIAAKKSVTPVARKAAPQEGQLPPKLAQMMLQTQMQQMQLDRGPDRAALFPLDPVAREWTFPHFNNPAPDPNLSNVLVPSPPTGAQGGLLPNYPSLVPNPVSPYDSVPQSVLVPGLSGLKNVTKGFKPTHIPNQKKYAPTQQPGMGGTFALRNV